MGSAESPNTSSAMPSQSSCRTGAVGRRGWALRLIRNKRTIVYLSPARGYFLASFALGGKAIEAAKKSRLPGPVLKIIDEAKQYAEGTAVRIEVKAAADVEAVKTLAAVKLKN